MTGFDPESHYHVSDGNDDGNCPNCEEDITSDKAIGKMTQEEINTLEANICPFCGYSLFA